MNELRSDPQRTSRVINILMDWYNDNKRDGVLKDADVPESRPPADVKIGSYEHIMFITFTVSIDYMRDAAQLWDSARRTWEDEETRWVFYPDKVAKRTMDMNEPAELVNALAKHKLSKRRDKDAKKIWGPVALSFNRLFEGDPRKLFADLSYDALEIYCQMCKRNSYHKHFPYLSGPKILPLWIRMLHTEAGIKFKNLDEVPLPMDIHVARSTITTGCLVGRFEGKFNDFAVKAQEAWREACQHTKYYPLQLDEPLWNLSRLGCSKRRDEEEECPRKHECRLADFCTANDPSAIIKINATKRNVSIRTRYPQSRGDVS